MKTNSLFRVLFGLLMMTMGAAFIQSAALAAAPVASQYITLGASATAFDLATVSTVAGFTGTIVRFDTVPGKFNVETLATAAPNHVANFLAYVNVKESIKT